MRITKGETDERMDDRRLKIYYVKRRALLDLANRDGQVPEGAEVHTVFHDLQHQSIGVVVEHESFEPVADGCMLPVAEHGIGDGLLSERQQAVAKLREICGEFGDNAWPDELHLADVVEKHLAKYLWDAQSKREAIRRAESLELCQPIANQEKLASDG